MKIYHLRKYRPPSTISFPPKKKNINTNFRDPQRTPHRSNGLFPNPWFHVKKSRSISWTFFCEAVVSQCFTHVFFKYSPRKLGFSWSNVTFAHRFFNQLGVVLKPTNPPAKKVKNSCISCVFMKLVFMIYIVASSWNMKPVQVGTGRVSRERWPLNWSRACRAPPWSFQKKTSPNWKNLRGENRWFAIWLWDVKFMWR